MSNCVQCVKPAFRTGVLWGLAGLALGVAAVIAIAALG